MNASVKIDVTINSQVSIRFACQMWISLLFLAKYKKLFTEMKKSFSIVLLFIFSITMSYAQSSVWKISKKRNTTYLAGSIHILSEDDYPLPEEFDKAYSKADLLVFEADIIKMEDQSFVQKMMAMSMYTDDRTLQSVLSEDTYNELKVLAIKMNLPIEQMNIFKPSFVLLMVTVSKMQQMGMNTEGVDKHFLSKALNDSLELEFFETPEEQLQMITGMGEGNEDQFVAYSLRDMQHMEEDLTQLVSDWRDGSSEKMIEQIQETKKDYPNFYKSLLVDRNNNWLPKIEQYLESKTTELIIVGAMHLHGPEGVLALLKDKGYKVAQVK